MTPLAGVYDVYGTGQVGRHVPSQYKKSVEEQGELQVQVPVVEATRGELQVFKQNIYDLEYHIFQ